MKPWLKELLASEQPPQHPCAKGPMSDAQRADIREALGEQDLPLKVVGSLIALTMVDNLRRLPPQEQSPPIVPDQRPTDDNP